MGVEIVFILIYPIALICLVAAIIIWLPVARSEQPTLTGYAKAYLPLVIGFCVSMTGLVILSYVDASDDFTSLIQGGYYTEAQRPTYLPGRAVGQVILNLVFILPAICLVIVPWTVRLIRKGRLRFTAIGIRALMGWIVLSVSGWVLFRAVVVPPDTLSDFLKSAVIPVLIYGLPIPIAALFFVRRLGWRNGTI